LKASNTTTNYGIQANGDIGFRRRIKNGIKYNMAAKNKEKVIVMKIIKLLLAVSMHIKLNSRVIKYQDRIK
jgi:hypothetical protein